MNQIGFTAPHHLASQTGMKILRQGGSAIDAMVAAAASIAVVYPHMNSIGGDSFWLIQKQGEPPIAIDACGRSAQSANPDDYQTPTLPSRGEAACICQAGTVSGWQLAREYLAGWRQPITLDDVFQDAISYCEKGFPVTQSFVRASDKTVSNSDFNQAFKDIYTAKGRVLAAGDNLANPDLAELFRQLSRAGLNDFYQGKTADLISRFFKDSDSPLAAIDFSSHKASLVSPLTATTSRATLYNLPAPTQGIASLLILAIYDRLYDSSWSEADQVHHLVEATKQAFQIRNRYLADPAELELSLASFLQDDKLDELCRQISSTSSLPWPNQALPGDTVWMGAIDDEGTMVSFIQSIYWEFGSGIVVPETGIIWNNRGVSFSLNSDDINYLRPGRKPAHTLNPALAILNDGRRLVYGTMGGEGQPQTQAAVFNRYVYQQKTLEDAVASPRWLLGRTWGDNNSHSLKLEAALVQVAGAGLKQRGHEVEIVPNCNEMMGHAGAVVIYPNKDVFAATDPRSDGAAFSEASSRG